MDIINSVRALARSADCVRLCRVTSVGDAVCSVEECASGAIWEDVALSGEDAPLFVAEPRPGSLAWVHFGGSPCVVGVCSPQKVTLGGSTVSLNADGSLEICAEGRITINGGGNGGLVVGEKVAVELAKIQADISALASALKVPYTFLRAPSAMELEESDVLH